MEQEIAKILLESEDYKLLLTRQRRQGAKDLIKRRVATLGGLYLLPEGTRIIRTIREAELYFQRLFDICRAFGFSDDEIRYGIKNIKEMNHFWLQATNYHKRIRSEGNPIDAKHWTRVALVFSDEDAFEFLVSLFEKDSSSIEGK